MLIVKFALPTALFLKRACPVFDVDTPLIRGERMSWPDGDFARLIGLARAGDANALGALLDVYREQLRESAKRQLGSRVRVRVDASDVVQQTALSAVRSIGDFGGYDEAAFLSWLEQIQARNIADCIRQHVNAERRSIDREVGRQLDQSNFASNQNGTLVGVGNDAIQIEQGKLLQAALETLPVDQREAVSLRHIEGKTIEEVASALARSKPAVAGLIKRGIKRLRSTLAERGG
jgi:RNA polymerase sigma-70 factor (ECF subfamily)